MAASKEEKPSEGTRHQDARPRKDRLIQTRVDEELERTLKQEAAKRRLSVSHLIRNLLEDSFHLMDNMVENVDGLVQDSLGLADQLKRDAARIAKTARAVGASTRPKAEIQGEKRADAPAGIRSAVPSETTDLSQVLAWNPVVLNRQALCSICGKSLSRGERAHLGLGGPEDVQLWLCQACLDELQSQT